MDTELSFYKKINNLNAKILELTTDLYMFMNTKLSFYEKITNFNTKILNLTTKLYMFVIQKLYINEKIIIFTVKILELTTKRSIKLMFMDTINSFGDMQKSSLSTKKHKEYRQN